MSLEPATSDKSLVGEQQHKLGEQQLQEEVEEQPKRVPPVEVGKRGWLNKRFDGIPFVSVSGKFVSPPQPTTLMHFSSSLSTVLLSLSGLILH